MEVVVILEAVVVVVVVGNDATLGAIVVLHIIYL